MLCIVNGTFIIDHLKFHLKIFILFYWIFGWMWMGYFPIPRMDRLMNKEVKWCTPDHSAIQWLNIFAPLELFPLCLFSAYSPGWWVLASHQILAHLEAASKTETSAPPTCTRPAYLLGQPFPFLLSPVDRSHLPQVLQSYLGLAVKEEPSRWLWQPPGTKRRMENEWHWNGHCDGLWWPLGHWMDWVVLMLFLKPEYTLFHLPDLRKKEKPLLSAELGRLGDTWPPFFCSTSFREFLQCT